MAKATVIEQPRVIEQCTLVLDADETRALMHVLNNVGGNPTTSRRGVVKRIRDVMIEAGVDYNPQSPYDSDGVIRFLPS